MSESSNSFGQIGKGRLIFLVVLIYAVRAFLAFSCAFSRDCLAVVEFLMQPLGPIVALLSGALELISAGAAQALHTQPISQIFFFAILALDVWLMVSLVQAFRAWRQKATKPRRAMLVIKVYLTCLILNYALSLIAVSF